jgi:hypothetical protein
MLDRFGALIQSLSEVFGLPLYVDANHACAIQIRRGLIVQLQPDPPQEHLLLLSKIGEIPPGKFRELVFVEALKANGMPDPIVGIFSFASKTGHLVLFQRYPFDILTGERTAALIVPFLQKAEQWKGALESGRPSPFDTPHSHPPGGLR